MCVCVCVCVCVYVCVCVCVYKCMSKQIWYEPIDGNENETTEKNEEIKEEESQKSPQKKRKSYDYSIIQKEKALAKAQEKPKRVLFDELEKIVDLHLSGESERMSPLKELKNKFPTQWDNMTGMKPMQINPNEAVRQDMVNY